MEWTARRSGVSTGSMKPQRPSTIGFTTPLCPCRFLNIFCSVQRVYAASRITSSICYTSLRQHPEHTQLRLSRRYCSNRTEGIQAMIYHPNFPRAQPTPSNSNSSRALLSSRDVDQGRGANDDNHDNQAAQHDRCGLHLAFTSPNRKLLPS